MARVSKIMFKQIAPMLFQSFLKGLEFDNLFESSFSD